MEASTKTSVMPFRDLWAINCLPEGSEASGSGLTLRPRPRPRPQALLPAAEAVASVPSSPCSPLCRESLKYVLPLREARKGHGWVEAGLGLSPLLLLRNGLRTVCLRICSFWPPVTSAVSFRCATCILPTRFYCSFWTPVCYAVSFSVLRALCVRANYATRSRFFFGNRLWRKFYLCHAGCA